MDTLTRLRQVAGKALRSYPVRFAYLHGSHIRGTASHHSDVDVAVMLDDSVDEGDYLDLALDLAGRLEQAAGVGPVEVIVLNRAPLPVAGRVVSEGRPFFTVDEPGRVTYDSLVFRQFVDFDRQARQLDEERLRDHAGGAR